jgi:ABC-2 type transport system permease protein
MNANAPELAPVPAAAPALTGRAGTLDTLATLARREFWEHRSLWLAPLVAQALLALAVVFGHAELGHGDHEVLTPPQRVALFTIVQWALAQPLFFVTCICVSFYLLDCLYAERKDRSILFWKSLPVSDGLTIASKALVAAAVVPLGVFALALVSNLLFAAVLAARLPGVLGWSTVEWLRTQAVLLVSVILGVLWYAPIAGAMLLLSAWARRPILWASLVPLMAPILERVALGTHYLWNFETYRVVGIWHKLQVGHEHVFDSAKDLHPVGVVLDTFNIRGAFTDMDLWLGVIAAIAMTYAAARIRRYRDDSGT